MMLKENEHSSSCDEAGEGLDQDRCSDLDYVRFPAKGHAVISTT
jgi:hypothetical protein